MFYAGIGARKTPDNVLQSMEAVAAYLASEGHTLRSGGADGADMAFENGCDRNQGKKQIFLPWEGFNNHPTSNRSNQFITRVKAHAVARDMAEKFHPAWGKLNEPAQRMMIRNCYQVLGPHLASKSDFILCWTPGGKVTGGTGQALRIAKHYEIPVLNFGSKSLDKIESELMKILKG